MVCVYILEALTEIELIHSGSQLDPSEWLLSLPIWEIRETYDDFD